MTETAKTPAPDLDAMPSPTGAKTLALIDLLAKHPAGLSSAEAARKSGITGNLVFRVLKTLVEMGYATQREDNKLYALSNRLLDLSRPKVGDRSLVLCAHEALRSLRDDTGETVQLTIESGGKKQRGLLDDTLFIWGGEFGRTPVSENGNGRDHNPIGYTMWMAGGGIKGGMAYGATDEFGFKAVENRVSIHDIHATILHQLGIDHEKFTYRYSGRDFRLTDVHGEVIHKILA